MSGAHGYDFGAEHFHAVDVEGLAGAVDGAHVDDALEAEHGGDGGGGDAVLAGAGFGDDPGFAHAFGEEDLADGVVDLVCSGVEEVFAFEVYLGSAEGFGEAFGVVERGGASAEFLEVVGEFFLEGGVEGSAVVFFLEFGERVDEGFGDVTSAVGAEVAEGVRQVGGGGLAHGWER